MTNLTGQYLDRYHILEQLGEGGMATVYKAYDTRLERLVALKVIRKDAFPPGILENVLQRFVREAKALARLSHPHIIKVYDFGEYEGAPYLVMEFIPGGTLKSHVGKQLSWNEAARLLLPVARALSYAHGENIIHRDVKPANILLTESGEPRLGDFGIAKIIESTEGMTLTGTGVGIGTPEYMAPEQGMGNTVDARADIYALGIMLYELITGRKPYIADTPMAVLLKHVTDPLPSPKALVPDLPDPVEWFLAKSLAKEPANRFPDMDAFINSLERLMREVPFTPPLRETTAEKTIESTPEYQPGLPAARKSRTWMWITGGGILLLAAAGVTIVGFLLVALLRGSPRASATPLPAFTQLSTDTPGPVSATLPSSIPTATEQILAATSLPAPTSPQAAASEAFPTITPSLGIGSTLNFPVDGMTLVYVPAGEFLMGASANDSAAEEHEKPSHTVFLDAYWIDQVEVTNAMYALCVVDGVCPPPLSSNSYAKQPYYNDPAYASYPVIWITWEGARAYCSWAGRRLPTEAEWEKAARGTQGYLYPWGDEFDGSQVNYCDQSCPKDYRDTVFNDGYVLTGPVQGFPNDISPYGALDMAGNVAEWVADFYSAEYYKFSPEKNPTGPTNFEGYYVVRGGSWYGMRSSLRTTRRGYSESNGPGTVTGFRCALSAVE